MMRVDPNQIAPSQDFLKEKTVRFILQCIREGKDDQLPPPPIVRKDAQGKLVAIDGHNLLAVRAYRGEFQEVHVAKAPDDGLPEISKSNVDRNNDLREKFDACLLERDRAGSKGVRTMMDLIGRYPELFNKLS